MAFLNFEDAHLPGNFGEPVNDFLFRFHDLARWEMRCQEYPGKDCVCSVRHSNTNTGTRHRHRERRLMTACYIGMMQSAQ